MSPSHCPRMQRIRLSSDRRRRRLRRAISMVESLMAVTVTTIAGAAMLTSIGAAVKTSSDSSHAIVAMGLAEQLMDEIAATRFPAATSTRPGNSSDRLQYDDIDDYSGLVETPLRTRSGTTVGEEGYPLFGFEYPRLYQMRPNWDLLGRFRREVLVERVQPDGNGGWTVTSKHTDFRRVSVRVVHTDAQSTIRTLADISRIFSYVPIAP